MSLVTGENIQRNHCEIVDLNSDLAMLKSMEVGSLLNAGFLLQAVDPMVGVALNLMLKVLMICHEDILIF